jgi:hypothetical protein
MKGMHIKCFEVYETMLYRSHSAAQTVRHKAHVGFVMEKVALGQVCSEYFGFPCQFSFHQLLHTHHLSSWAGTTGQLVPDVPSGLSLTPPQETK